ncbi:MAG: tetratricopeptide repeat protein [Candidatus Polarisedimenticolia bacterium]
MSRLHRKDYKKDELVTTLESLTLSAERHMRSLLIAGVAVVALVAAVVGGIWYSRSRSADAAAGLAAVHKAMDAPIVATGAPEGMLSFSSVSSRAQEVLQRAEALLSSHPSSRQAHWATYWKGVAQKDLGRFDEAQATLDPLTTLDDEPFLSALARMQRAQVSEAKGDLAAAAESYASLAASAPARFPAEIALMNQARVLDAQGKAEEAKAIYRRVTQEYPESPYASDAARRIAPTSS